VRGIHGFSSFRGLQESLHCPVDLPMHSLFVPEDSIHIAFGQERRVVETCIGSVIFDAGPTVVVRLE
jgi:hypothetical protein